MEYTSTISFPGLKIGEFQITNVAFHVGKLTVMWYGIIICIGIICAFSYFAYRSGKAGIKFDDIVDITLVTVPSAIVGARLYFVIFYGGARSFLDIIAIWNGGLAIYGGIIGGAIAVIIMCRHKKLGFFALADMICPGVMTGQLIGRWGNFCNGEAFGGIASESSPLYFLRMGLRNHLTASKFGTYETVFVQPTFLYESVWNLIGFILINVFYKKRKFDGEIMLWYFGWYGFGRMFIEQLRTDSLYIGSTGIRVSSLLGFVFFIIALPLVIFLRVKLSKMKKHGEIEEDETVSIPRILGIKKKAAKTVDGKEGDGDGTDN